MTETQQPEFTDENYDLLWEVAHASKDARSLAAGARQVDAILQPLLSGFHEITLAEQAQLAENLFDIYRHWPEVFTHLGLDAKTTPNDILTVLPKILRAGGLPHDDSSAHNPKAIKADVYDKLATSREKTAEVLHSHQPSLDFFHDANINTHEFKRDKIGLVTKLLDHSESYLASAEEAIRDSEWNAENIQERQKKEPRLKILLNLVERASCKMTTQDREEYDRSFRELLNNPATTIADIEEFWYKGCNIIVAGRIKKSIEALVIYDMIMSGEAATYSQDDTGTIESKVNAQKEAMDLEYQFHLRLKNL